MSRGAHSISVVALAIALFALVVQTATFVTFNRMLRLFYAVITTVLLLKPLRCPYSDRIEDAACQVKVVTAL